MKLDNANQVSFESEDSITLPKFNDVEIKVKTGETEIKQIPLRGNDASKLSNDESIASPGLPIMPRIYGLSKHS